MCTDRGVGRCAILALAAWAAVLTGWPGDVRGDDSLSPSAAAGRTLFVRRWEPWKGRGDGLGPVYNAESCVACHRQGGIGGGGPRDNDVELVTHEGQRRPLEDKLAAVLTGTRSNTLLLHTYGTSPGYAKWRKSVLDPPLPTEDDPQGLKLETALRLRRRDLSLPVPVLRHEGYRLRLSRRQTPALFGLGPIDSIPDSAIKAEAARQLRENPGIAGRIASSNAEFDDPISSAGQRTVRVGRFGWRGQIGSLREFVISACSNELGLEAPGHAQPRDPMSFVPFAAKAALADPFADPQPSSGRDPFGGPAPPRPPATPVDITDPECRALSDYVASLPRPVQVLPRDRQEVSAVHQGAELFGKTGCAVCHVRELGPVDGLYSDLLLHDMGPDLMDPVPANPEIPPGTVIPLDLPSNYYGASIQVTGLAQRQWRTPPLWGVRDSAPYLHDGRAQTLLDAIEQHGGQGERARMAFQRLPKTDRDRVVAFLNSLAAPREAERLAAR